MKACWPIRWFLLFALLTTAAVSISSAQTDPTFNASVNSTIYSLIPQADGKVLVAGAISLIDGAPRNYIGRVNSDGSLDFDFDPSADGEIYAAACLANGQILLGGSFTNIAGQVHNRIVRLNADGTPDATFATGISSGVGVLYSGSVNAIAVQSDGKIIVGGYFTTLNGQPRNYLGRYNSDGSVDDTFISVTDGTVNTIALQPDGKILVGGSFQTMGGQPVSHFARLNTNGTLDTNFVAVPGNYVYATAVQADGKILLGGYYTGVNGQGRDTLARLNTDGSLDTNFNANVPLNYQGRVKTIAIQADGKILVGGEGTVWSESLRYARLNSDGSADTNFVAGSNSEVTSIALQRDGKILRPAFASLLRMTNEPATASLVFSNSTLTWQRGGSAPEVWRTTFEYSTNRTDWTFIGAGTRIAGGWQCTGVSVPTSAHIRARGFAVGGFYNGSSWFVEAYNGGPFILSQPVTRINKATTSATFTALAEGSPPLAYRWLKNGSNLVDGGNVTGPNTDTLNLMNVLGSDAGTYSVVVSNLSGSVTGVVANFSVIDPWVYGNPFSEFVHRGQTATFNVFLQGSADFHYQWRKEGVPLPGRNASSLVLTNTQETDAGSYDVVVTNAFGSVTSALARLTVNIATADSSTPYLAGYVHTTAIQPDGKTLIAGYFTRISDPSVYRLARLNADGSLDTTFSPVLNAEVISLGLQTDGKILVGGSFTSLGGQPCNYLGRLNPGGSLDTSFAPAPNGPVYGLLAQPDGTILVSGGFTNIAGVSRQRLARLFGDGSLDTNFNASLDDVASALAVQEDGKILVGGYFSMLSGQPRANIGRLNMDGTVDMAFNPAANGQIYSLALQADGKILVGGYFTGLGGGFRNDIGRLNSNGTLDLGFNPGATYPRYGPVYSLAVQADGKIVLGGSFNQFAGQSRSNIVRLQPDGSLDAAFGPQANASVRALAVQANGKIVVGGSFNSIGGRANSCLARLDDTKSATESLSSDAASIIWLRGGSGPEVALATFETSTNGTDWVYLGAGQRVSGGWQLTGLTLPTNATIRARGHTASGSYQNTSGWFIETQAGSPLASLQPASRTNNAATTATFSVFGVGGEPMQFQWLKNGTALTNGGNFSGAKTPTLTLSNVFGTDAGGYSVILSNAFGSVTSTLATLTVIDPLITTNPASQFAHVGQSATFTSACVGSVPLNFQWRQNGAALPGANSPSLTLTNLQAANAGGYDVVISNAFGSVTSSVATLTVNLAVPDSFNPGVNGTVYVLALQSDGKILVGGTFTNLGGQFRRNLGRLNPDGTLDSSFVSNYTNNSINALLLQADGRVLVAGWASEQNQQSFRGLWRVGADGTFDSSFTNVFNNTINALALAPDGVAWVGGTFVKTGVATNLARINADGTLDSNFTASVNVAVRALAVQTDGKLVISGSFTTVNGTNRNRIARFNTDGSLDAGFNPNANGDVNAVAVQPDGKILIAGSFGIVGGGNRSRLARLNPNGTLDTNFTTAINGQSGTVSTFALQSDGKILLGGSFTNVGGMSRSRLARLNSDGAVDSSFNPGANSTVNALVLQEDGSVLVGGGVSSVALIPITQIGGQVRTNIGRLVPTEPATQSITFNGATVTWDRGGSSPLLWRVSFEGSTNGVDWIPLGDGTWVNNGWQLGGLSFPLRSMIRARGFITGGLGNGSGWFTDFISPSAVPPQLILGSLNSGFNVLGVQGQAVVVEATTDFMGWVPLQTNVVTELGEFLFVDLEAGLYPARFYRARIFNGTLPPPTLGSGINFSRAGFHFDLTGTVGQKFMVETSTNLWDWTPLATNTLSTAETNFIDFGAANHPWNFYRLKLQP